MRLYISDGNSKIGQIPNLSFPPKYTCKAKLCYREGCYALKSYKMFKNVRTAWGANQELFEENPEEFFVRLRGYLLYHRPKLFRMFVAGDFPNQEFVDRFQQMARIFPDVRFLAFTKQYKLDYKALPPNVQLVYSAWPGMDLPEDSTKPVAWLSCDERKPESYYKCPGNCEECGNQCWSLLTKDIHVVFDKH